MEPARILPLELPRGRLMVISDIHGNLPYLRGLLEKLKVREEDKLLFLGDMVEKGPESLETLRLVMELCQRGQALAVCGNCDAVCRLFPMFEGYSEFLRTYVLGRRSLLGEMGERLGFPMAEDTDVDQWQREIYGAFRPEIDFLRSLPTGYETEEFLFLHGGTPQGPRETWEAFACMKLDNFRAQGNSQEKTCVVGHWPTALYGERYPDASPHFDWERKIVSIDGGCVLKPDGQLNALVLDRGELSWESYDALPVLRALDPQKEGGGSVYLRWGDNQVEVLERGEEFSRCRHLRTGRELEVPAGWLFRWEGELCVQDITNYRLPVEPGDRLRLVLRTSRGCYCKKNGRLGWYCGRTEPEEGDGDLG